MSTPTNIAGVSILIVEDSATQAMMLQYFLEQQGCVVRWSPNGRKALEALAERAPTIVISDINMPEMDGYELCRRIRSDPRHKDLPVILLTSLSDPKDVIAGLQSGADSFIVKPYDEKFLLSRIDYVLTNQKLRAEACVEGTVEVAFGGETYLLSSERIQMIDFLLCTYEVAVQKNIELEEAKKQVEAHAVALREKNEQMESDLQLARDLQHKFLPQKYPIYPKDVPPEQSAVQFCHRYRSTTELGGDFFDLLPVSDTQAGVLICDVMGHGVRAALVTAVVRGLVQELRSSAGDPGGFMTQLNNALQEILKEIGTPLFTSAFYVLADLRAGSLQYASAGHASPLHVRRAAGVVEPLPLNGNKPGPALGVFPNSVYQTFDCPLAAEDILVLFTDGLYEVEGRDGAFYDLKKLLGAVTARSHLRAEELIDSLVTEIEQFGVDGFDDDVCVVGMEVSRLITG